MQKSLNRKSNGGIPISVLSPQSSVLSPQSPVLSTYSPVLHFARHCVLSAPTAVTQSSSAVGCTAVPALPLVCASGGEVGAVLPAHPVSPSISMQASIVIESLFMCLPGWRIRRFGTWHLEMPVAGRGPNRNREAREKPRSLPVRKRTLASRPGWRHRVPKMPGETPPSRIHA